jgi:hypothetical protein
MVTERFHFYHRFRVRGIRHIVFYAPPLFPWMCARAPAPPPPRAGVPPPVPLVSEAPLSFAAPAGGSVA